MPYDGMKYIKFEKSLTKSRVLTYALPHIVTL